MAKYLINTESGKLFGSNMTNTITKNSFILIADNSDQAIAQYNLTIERNILIFGHKPDYTIITDVKKIDD